MKRLSAAALRKRLEDELFADEDEDVDDDDEDDEEIWFEDELEEMSIKEIREIAKELKIKNIAKKKKADLIEAILDAQDEG